MTIFNYTSQMNEVVRSLSLKDALDQLNELKTIKERLGLPKQIERSFNSLDRNFYHLTTHLRIDNIPRTNNHAELTNKTTMSKQTKKIYKKTKEILSRLITIIKNKNYKKETEM